MFGRSFSSTPSISQSVNRGSWVENILAKSTTGPAFSISSSSASIFLPTRSFKVSTYWGKKKGICWARNSRCTSPSRLINELKAACIKRSALPRLVITAIFMLPRCEENSCGFCSTCLTSSYRDTDQNPEVFCRPGDHMTGDSSRIL